MLPDTTHFPVLPYPPSVLVTSSPSRKKKSCHGSCRVKWCVASAKIALLANVIAIGLVQGLWLLLHNQYWTLTDTPLSHPVVVLSTGIQQPRFCGTRPFMCSSSSQMGWVLGWASSKPRIWVWVVVELVSSPALPCPHYQGRPSCTAQAKCWASSPTLTPSGPALQLCPGEEWCRFSSTHTRARPAFACQHHLWHHRVVAGAG